MTSRTGSASLESFNDNWHPEREVFLTIPTHCLEHKTLMIALLSIARQAAHQLQVELETPVAELCRLLDANRTSIYEQRQRILNALESLTQAQPGRPPGSPDDSHQDPTSLQLTITVLEFQLRHPGSIEHQKRRTCYAPQFQRFLLEQHDSWQGTDEAFAQAVKVPIDTLRDWFRRDREGLRPEPLEKQIPKIPRSASQLTRRIAEEWQTWIGSTRGFLRYIYSLLHLLPDQTIRVLRILALVAPRRWKDFRYRNSTRRLSPGTLLVTDGKLVHIQLIRTGRNLALNWQAMVDQTTACHTAAPVSQQENAQTIFEAYEQSQTLLGDTAPEGLLHDNKPCYDEQQLREKLQDAGTTPIPATLGRPQNKALLEGEFGLFEQRVGTLRFDDTSQQTLIRSAVEEVLRAYTAATNSVPRIEWDGKSRLQVLRQACPSPEQKLRDQKFLERLRASHTGKKRRKPKVDPRALQLLDEIFERFELLDKDPQSKLRRYLAGFRIEAIRRAAALFASKLDQGVLQPRYAHRYLVKLIRSQQDELDLERAAKELLELCQQQNEDWLRHEEIYYQTLVEDWPDPEQLARAVAERAAHGGIPLQATFWTQKLLQYLREAAQLIQSVKQHLIRLYEAPFQQRLALLDAITAMECQIA